MFDYICGTWICSGNSFLATTSRAGSRLTVLFLVWNQNMGPYGMNSGWAPLPPSNFLPTHFFRETRCSCDAEVSNHDWLLQGWGFNDSEWPPDVTNGGFRRTAGNILLYGNPCPTKWANMFFLNFWGGWYVPVGPTPWKSHGTCWGLQIPFLLFEGLIFSFQTFFI